MQTYLLASSYLFLFSSSLNLFIFIFQKQGWEQSQENKRCEPRVRRDGPKEVSKWGRDNARKEPVYRHASVSENMDEVKKLPTDTNHTAAEMDQNGPKEIGQTRTKKV